MIEMVAPVGAVGSVTVTFMEGEVFPETTLPIISLFNVKEIFVSKSSVA
jgi:hypothetical protein